MGCRIKIVGLLLILLVLSSCWDARELEDQAYVVAMGIDKGLVEDSIVISLEIANPQVGSSDTAKADKEPPKEIVTFAVPDKVTVRDLANISVSRRITYDQLRTMIISEEFMKDGLFETIMDALLREPEFQRDVSLIVTKEKAYEFMNNQNHTLETRPHKHYAFMIKRWEDTGLSPETGTNRLFQRIQEDAGLFLAAYATVVKEKSDDQEQGSEDEGKSEGDLEPSEEQKYKKEDEYLPGEVIKKGGNPTQMIGSAVIKEGTMIGTLNGEETRLALLMRPKSVSSNWIAIYEDPLDKKTHVSARLTKNKTKVKVNVDNGKFIINCTVKASVDILSVKSYENYATDLKKQQLLKKSIQKQLEKKAMKLVNKSQKELEGDIFQWSASGRKEFFTIDEYKDFDWMKSYPNAKVNVSFDVHIKGFGKQFDPTDMKRIKD